MLLPANSDESAASLRRELEERTGLRLAVVINDSLGRAWRRGTVGTALGSSGLPALLDLRGKPDRHGRLLRSTEVGVADEVAATASLLMGQASEGGRSWCSRLPVPAGRGYGEFVDKGESHGPLSMIFECETSATKPRNARERPGVARVRWACEY